VNDYQCAYFFRRCDPERFSFDVAAVVSRTCVLAGAARLGTLSDGNGHIVFAIFADDT
jgi:hypothetical protein